MTAKTQGRTRRRAIPWVMLGLWVAILALAMPFAGKTGDVQQDRAVDYLPASADSTRVAKIQEQLPGGESTELVLVYHRDGGLTAQDKATAQGQIDEIAGQHKLVGTPEAVPAKGGDTLFYPVASNEPGSDEKLRDAFVNEVREVAEGSGGLSVDVGGPGALATDASEVYNALDGPLLYTTVAVVAILLIIIYRSPLLWLVPLIVAGIADMLSLAVTYGLHQTFDITVSGQSTGIMTVLVFGAGTDYALLLIARYREELRRQERPLDAMATALRGCGPAILASSGTVAAGMLCLLAADLNSSSGMGPTAAVGVLCALVTMTTLLPALLVLLGRRVFWPLIPAFGSAPKQRRSVFGAMGASVQRRPLAVLVSSAVVLGALALGAFNLSGNVKQEDSFTKTPEAVRAMTTLSDAYPERSSQPITILAPNGEADRVLGAARDTKGVSAAEQGRSGDTWTEISVIAEAPPQSAAETATIEKLRDKLDTSLVGGPSAQQLDLQDTSSRDTMVVVPIVLLSVLLILIVLLRSLVAPLLLTAAVVAVWGASLGIGGLVFDSVFGFEGSDSGLPLISFVFLVALGVDYGIFLMHRMREEVLGGQDTPTAALTALRTTGGVIASAGLVLAATFGVLMNMPLVQLVEMGFVVSVGVLLDTFLVRTYLVTSASMVLGSKVWWPGPLSKLPARTVVPERTERPAATV